MKHRIAAASIMGFLTTGIITFVLVTINLGFNERFFVNWCRSWLVAYVIIVPLIFLIGPKVQQFVSCLFRKQ
ncbi:MAG TPA: DUF2798 domain-containing protein [Pedobacter sp.]|nr:DUF2798 domain-containing protein [Pedobacter sp.]